jgi:hypothetical protein
MDKLKDALTQRMARMIPVANKVFESAKFEVEKMSTIAAGVYKAVGWLADKIVDGSGLRDYMQSLADKFCKMFGNPFMAISAEFLKASCGTLEFANGVGSWKCTKECADDPAKAVTYAGNKQICEDKKSGAGNATCFDGVSDDDKSDDDDEVSDEDFQMTKTQELFENVEKGADTPDIVITKKTSTPPAENTGQEYFNIYYNSFLDGGEAQPVTKMIGLRGLGEPLYASGFPGMNVVFYLDWAEYYQEVTPETAPAGFVIKGSGWNGWLLFEKPEIQIFDFDKKRGSIWINIVLPDDLKYLGTHEVEMAFLNQKADGTPDLGKAGKYSTFSLKLVEKEGFVSCHSDLQCDTETQKCDFDYYYCIPK